MLLLAFFGSPILALPAGPGLAFILPYHDTLLAFPFELEEHELVITTCLTIHEMNSLERQVPTLAFNVHYGAAYAVPRIRHWFPAKWMFDRYAKWERKAPLPPLRPDMPPALRWHRVAQLIRDVEMDKGHGHGTKFNFLDHVPGPYAVEYLRQPAGTDAWTSGRFTRGWIPIHIGTKSSIIATISSCISAMRRRRPRNEARPVSAFAFDVTTDPAHNRPLIMAKGNNQKQSNGSALDFEAQLWAAADKMRGHMDASEYKHVCLGLIFLKYISTA